MQNAVDISIPRNRLVEQVSTGTRRLAHEESMPTPLFGFTMISKAGLSLKTFIDTRFHGRGEAEKHGYHQTPHDATFAGTGCGAYHQLMFQGEKRFLRAVKSGGGANGGVGVALLLAAEADNRQPLPA